MYIYRHVQYIPYKDPLELLQTFRLEPGLFVSGLLAGVRFESDKFLGWVAVKELNLNRKP